MNTQKGFALLELVVVALLATLLAVWASGTLVYRMDEVKAQAGAAWMLTVRQSVQRYIQRYAEYIASADADAVLAQRGYTNWATPTLAQLKADSLLPTAFPERVSPGDGASVQVLRSGACPGPDCRIQALVYSNKPLLQAGRTTVDQHMVAQWLMASQGWGGRVSSDHPQFVRGASFAFPNPVAGGERLPPGTVALAINGSESDESHFLRVRDSRNPDFQGSADVKGSITTGADMHVKRYLYLQTEEERFAPCNDDGAVAMEHNGGLLICRNNEWYTTNRYSGGGFSNNLSRGCYNSNGGSTANPRTGACSCPMGTAIVQISDSGPHAAPEGRTLGYLCVD